VHRSSMTGDVSLVVEWRDATDRLLRRDASPPLPATAGTWQQLAVAARAPRGAAYARLELVARATTGPVWFDSVSFTP
jgi:hypothetical protein